MIQRGWSFWQNRVLTRPARTGTTETMPLWRSGLASVPQRLCLCGADSMSLSRGDNASHCLCATKRYMAVKQRKTIQTRFKMGPDGSIWANIKTGRSKTAQDHFLPLLTPKGYIKELKMPQAIKKYAQPLPRQ